MQGEQNLTADFTDNTDQERIGGSGHRGNRGIGKAENLH
jgi:hypothetical protein